MTTSSTTSRTFAVTAIHPASAGPGAAALPATTSIETSGPKGQPIGLVVCICKAGAPAQARAVAEARKRCTAEGIALAIVDVGQDPGQAAGALQSLEHRVNQHTSVILLDGDAGSSSYQNAAQQVIEAALLQLSLVLPFNGSSGTLAMPCVIDTGDVQHGHELAARLDECAVRKTALHGSHATRYLRSLERWVHAEPNDEKRADRRVASTKIQSWLAAGDPGAELNLGLLALDSLPPLPWTLKNLCIDHNLLTQLPADLPLLTRLSVQFNRLQNLAGVLPDSLTTLNASNNFITQLPGMLPPGLMVCGLQGNQLTDVATDLLLLPHDCVIDLWANPLSDETRASLEAAMISREGTGEGAEVVWENPAQPVDQGIVTFVDDENSDGESAPVANPGLRFGANFTSGHPATNSDTDDSGIAEQ